MGLDFGVSGASGSITRVRMTLAPYFWPSAPLYVHRRCGSPRKWIFLLPQQRILELYKPSIHLGASHHPFIAPFSPHNMLNSSTNSSTIFHSSSWEVLALKGFVESICAWEMGTDRIFQTRSNRLRLKYSSWPSIQLAWRFLAGGKLFCFQKTDPPISDGEKRLLLFYQGMNVV